MFVSYRGTHESSFVVLRRPVTNMYSLLERIVRIDLNLSNSEALSEIVTCPNQCTILAEVMHCNAVSAMVCQSCQWRAQQAGQPVLLADAARLLVVLTAAMDRPIGIATLPWWP